MNKLFLLSISLFASTIITAQVGINNTDPKATLDITAINTDATTPEGLIAPRLTGNEIKAKDLQYLLTQTGVIVYATAAASPTTPKTINITSAGYYFFDGTVWLKVSSNTDIADLRLVNINSHITIDAGVGSNGTDAGGTGIIAIGSGAANANAGDNNTFVGTNAGNKNIAATGISAFGSGALQNSTGLQNGAFGVNALQNITTSTGNSAFGTSALQNMTAGNNNTAFGIFAGLGIATGSDNTAIGYATLFNAGNGTLVAGKGNTAVGYQAIFQSTAGSNNSAFGLAALNSSTGSENTGLGENSGGGNTSGIRNVFVGSKSGRKNTTGSGNLALGYNANFFAVDYTNASAIGPLAQVNASNSMVLGAISGTNTAIASTNVGIGVTVPSNRLHVAAPIVATDPASGNPLRLVGLRPGLAADEILTVEVLTGVVRRVPAVSIAGIDATNDAWVNNGTRVELGTLADGTTIRPATAGFVALDNGNVGIGNIAPAATLDVRAINTNATTAEGLIAPRLTGNQIKTKDAEYQGAQTGAIVYATAAATGTPTPKTINITSAGYYYFDGDVWLKLTSQVVDLRLVTGDSHITVDAGVGSNGTDSGAINVIAIGKGAGSRNTKNNNILIGTSAGLVNTTGEENQFIGTFSGQANITGRNNNVYGYRGLTSNKAGNYNNGFGSLALQASTGNNNSAFGHSSSIVTTGRDNSAFGYQSLLNNTTGSYNTVIGSLSGGGIITGSNNTIIGARITTAADINNTIIIGDGSGNQRIYINNLGNIGIGTDAPTSKLQVVGLPIFSNNTTAGAGGLTLGAFYHNGDGIVRVVY